MKQLLIIADREDRKQVALERGLELAKALGAGVDIVAFCYERTSSLPEAVQQEVRDRLINEKQEYLGSKLDCIETHGLDLQQRVIWEKDIASWVNQRCTEHSYTAVIKTGNRSESFIYTPTDWQLLRECPTPVMLVAESKWRKSHPILAALDLGTKSPIKEELNDKVLSGASAWAKALDRELHVVYGLSVSPVLKDLDLIDIDKHIAEQKAKLKPIVDYYIRRYNLNPEHVHVKSNAPHKAILSVASSINADLLMIGTVGRKGAKAKLMGNTSERILQHLRTDLMAFKP